jgi:hypothetical protein
MSTKNIQHFIKKSDNILTNKTFTNTTMLVLIIYISFILPNLLQSNTSYIHKIISLFKNTFFKILVLLFIGYLVQINQKLAIISMIAVFMSFDTITRYEIENHLKQKIINDIKSKKNNREIKLHNVNPVSDSASASVSSRTSTISTRSSTISSKSVSDSSKSASDSSKSDSSKSTTSSTKTNSIGIGLAKTPNNQDETFEDSDLEYVEQYTKNISSGNISSGNISSGNISSGNISSGNISSGNISSGNIDSENIGLENYSSINNFGTLI